MVSDKQKIINCKYFVSKMKENILYIEPYLPYPLDNGGNQAIFNGLKAMQDYANLYVTFIVD